MKPVTRILFLTTAAAILLNLSPASATELSDFLSKFQPGDPCDWSGFYIGFNNGGSINHVDLSEHKTNVDLVEQFYDIVGEFGEGETAFATFHPSGHVDSDNQTIGGGQTGFNIQFGHFVIGAEGGFQANMVDSESKSKEFQENELFLITEQQFVTAETTFHSMNKVETNWNGTVGGKVGFCWKGFLIYGEGGAAFTDVHFSNKDIADTSFFGSDGEGPPGIATTTNLGAPTIRRVIGPRQGESFIGEIRNSKTHTQGDVLTGWYGGGGVSYLLTNLVSVGIDYKHVDWGDVTEHQMEGGGPVFPGNANLNLSADQITFEVNIKVGSMPFGGH